MGKKFNLISFGSKLKVWSGADGGRWDFQPTPAGCKFKLRLHMTSGRRLHVPACPFYRFGNVIIFADGCGGDANMLFMGL